MGVYVKVYNMSKREFTAVYKKRGNRYVAWIEEIPGVNTQGRTLKEAKENLSDALGLIVRANRIIGRRTLGADTRREPLFI